MKLQPSKAKVLYHTFKRNGANIQVTGWDPKEAIQPGTMLEMSEGTFFVKSVEERRDHNGVEYEQDENKNAFFRAIVEPVEVLIA